MSHSTNWRPSFLLLHLSKNRSKKTGAIKPFNDGVTHFLETLRKGHSLIFAAEICIGDFRLNLLNKIKKLEREHTGLSTELNNERLYSSGYLPVRTHISSRTHFKGKRVNGFLNKIVSESYRNGVQTALQTTGMGVLKPNTIVMALKCTENETENESILSNEEYVEILRDNLLSGFGLMLLCGFNNSDKIDWALQRYNIYNCDNIIDIYWLVDDGGLILLLPYIMRLHNFFIKCRVRINLVTDYTNKYNAIHYEQTKIKDLIRKFRLPFKDEPRIIKVKNNNINHKTLARFEQLSQCKIKSATRPNVICRWLRLSELFTEYSAHSSMIIVTLPIPNKFITPNQYMAILQIMSDQSQLPPTIIMRGNGQQTLTFNCE